MAAGVSQFEPFSPEAFRGKTLLLTGAGGGIGGAIAKRFGELGVRLALSDIREEPLQEVVAALEGVETLALPADLTDEAQAVNAVRQTVERFGGVDILVNTAGILRDTPIEQISKVEWEQVMSGNVTSAFLMCRECCAPMREAGWGRMINFSSISGQVGGIYSGAHYATAKAAVISLTRSFAKHLVGTGVRVNAIAPSGVETEMLRQYPAEIIAKLEEDIPLQRFAAPVEIAELALWLSSPATDYITGQVFNINGGAYLG